MDSKGRIAPHLKRSLPGPGLSPNEPFLPMMRCPPNPFPPVDLLPPPEVLEQKLASQHMEMQRLANENQRLAATHGILRQELAAAQQELQILHAQIGAVKSEREQQIRNLTEKIGKMEAELQAAEPVRSELQKARGEAQNLVSMRQELMAKVQHLSMDIGRTQTDLQQIPALMSELGSLKQEFQHCRVTYDYEKKLYDDHLKQLQVMEKNYMTMAMEVEKLRAELTKSANLGGAVGPQSMGTGFEVAGNSGPQAYGVSQVRGPLPPAASSNAALPFGAPAIATNPAPAGSQSWLAVGGHGYNANPAGYDHSAYNYNAYRAPSYDPQKGPDHDGQRAPGYPMPRGNSSYNPYKVPSGTLHGGPGYDTSRPSAYDGLAKVGTGQLGQSVLASSVVNPAATSTYRAGGSYDASTRG
ncbi:hypothetical protein MLD38_033834 [Melastoma candidum]|uniref:Uncharacterized protein n=1 Tax=Melastoma candidum TaxID=119954 RepID=A0ACB9M7P4_9MYRT|nr:hypothetical protein MLD38_033834 [Melastoma candidum]